MGRKHVVRVLLAVATAVLVVPLLSAWAATDCVRPFHAGAEVTSRVHLMPDGTTWITTGDDARPLLPVAGSGLLAWVPSPAYGQLGFLSWCLSLVVVACIPPVAWGDRPWAPWMFVAMAAGGLAVAPAAMVVRGLLDWHAAVRGRLLGHECDAPTLGVAVTLALLTVAALTISLVVAAICHSTRKRRRTTTAVSTDSVDAHEAILLLPQIARPPIHMDVSE